MSWTYLFAAILFEVAGTVAMRLSEGFTRLVPSLLIFAFYACAFTLMTFAIRKIEISVAYTIWAGIGTALIACIGMTYFGEQVTAVKMISILLIIAGVVGLRISAQ